MNEQERENKILEAGIRPIAMKSTLKKMDLLDIRDWIQGDNFKGKKSGIILTGKSSDDDDVGRRDKAFNIIGKELILTGYEVLKMDVLRFAEHMDYAVDYIDHMRDSDWYQYDFILLDGFYSQGSESPLNSKQTYLVSRAIRNLTGYGVSVCYNTDGYDGTRGVKVMDWWGKPLTKFIDKHTVKFTIGSDE